MLPKPKQSQTCPCHSGKKYNECCQPLHDGVRPLSALALMRSRYSAYALNLADYIIATTHPENPHYIKEIKDRAAWKQSISEFSKHSSFDDLDILEFLELSEVSAIVKFKASIKQNHQDVSFIEKSYFEKVGGQWLYHSALALESMLNR